MTHRLATNYAKNYCNRTPIVKVIVENVVTCFFWDTVYHPILLSFHLVVWKESFCYVEFCCNLLCSTLYSLYNLFVN